jgi:hypothetical protein
MKYSTDFVDIRYEIGVLFRVLSKTYKTKKMQLIVLCTTLSVSSLTHLFHHLYRRNCESQTFS